VASFAQVLSIPLVAIAVLAHNQSAKLPGKWKVKSVLLPASGPEAEKAKAMMMSSTIVFSKNKTFAMTLGGPMKGTWDVKGSEVALTIAEMMGRKMSEFVAMARANYLRQPSHRNKAALDELSKPLMAMLSSDGKTLTIKPTPGKAGLVFIKV